MLLTSPIAITSMQYAYIVDKRICNRRIQIARAFRALEPLEKIKMPKFEVKLQHLRRRLIAFVGLLGFFPHSSNSACLCGLLVNKVNKIDGNTIAYSCTARCASHFSFITPPNPTTSDYNLLRSCNRNGNVYHLSA